MNRSELLPLLPSQEWFMAELHPTLLNPNRWSLTKMYRLPPGLPHDAVRDSVRDLWRCHDALRIRLLHTEDGWRQEVADAAVPEPLRFIDLSRVPPSDRRAEVERVAVETHATLSIQAGPLIRFLHLNLGDREPGRLMMTVHHLAADGMSFARLQSELDNLLRMRASGAAGGLPRAAPYRDCVAAVLDYANSADLLGELDHWRAQPWRDCVELPADAPRYRTDSIRRWTTMRSVVSTADAQALVQRLPAALGVELEDVVMAALAETLTDWAGGAVCLQTVNHGRALKRDAMTQVLPPRAARTVGWLSTHGCLVVRPRTEGDPADYVRRVRDCATAAPNRGAGMTMLRWSTSPGAHTELVTQAWQAAQAVFNFGGQGMRALDGPLGATDEATGHRADPLEPKPALYLRANAKHGEVAINWDYDPQLRSPRTIAALAERCQEALSTYLYKLD
jgi:hypothetical protein